MKQNANREIPLIFEDNHLLVVEKPVNIPTQEDRTGDPDMLTLLKADLKQRHHKPGNVFLGLIHRLDRPVGGVMAFAKTSKAASRLSDDVRTRNFAKSYLAVVRGTSVQSSGKLVHYLQKHPDSNTVSVVAKSAAGAKQAVLEYEVLGQEEGLSLLRIELHTGRPHQIRVQLSAIGCPLYGDQKYGAEVNRPGQQIALWSFRVALRHPTRQERMTFISAPPEQYPWLLWHDIIAEAARSADNSISASDGDKNTR
ncbi:RluA family pseudouridine synthase [Ferviditalea candida]|uniref:RNA pseudouridylate synthase n=1 Tax=Ferviditalea candida TaxID=3108399 RepID=A0ABU5ZFR9_9BACL|nr:RluA family pseudouridine synthase [Paenibacillaceae bacterium T2]